MVKEPNAEPIPGYRLIEPLGTGGFGEVWKCEAPGGLFKAIKFVHANDDQLGNEPCNAAQELRALQHVKSIRHPFLLSMDRVERIGGELVIVMELADRSLHDLLVECRAAGAPGIPRPDLLLFLREAAEVLDLMNQEYGLQHLDVKPRNLFLVSQHVKVADFGLVNSLAEMAGQDQARFQLGAITPLYASPETFLGKITLFSDQYSLAVVFCELLTGRLPFKGKNFRQLALQHTSGNPDLSELSSGDQPVVARALAKDPRQRFPSCLDFIRALIAVPEEDLGRPAADTRAEQCPTSTATMADIQIVENKKRTATVARPTRVLRPETARDDAEAKSLDGFHFLDCLGRTPLGELWRAETPDGQPRMVKLVNTFNPGMGEETAAAQLRALRHPGLVDAQVLAHTSNRLAIISPPLNDNLATCLQAARARSQLGIPRLELLRHLYQAALTLDELRAQYGLQHLGLTPRNLLLIEGELRVADFGLMALLWIPGGQQPAQINPRYCAPELFQRRLSPHCDQYALALIFYELLTGDPVHGGRTPGQLARARSTTLDSLDMLPAADRPLLARALNPDPEKRYPGSVDLIRGLIENTPGGADLLHRDWTTSHREVDRVESVKIPESPPVTIDREAAGRVVNSIITDLAGARQLREVHLAPYYYCPGEEIEHRCHARIVPGTLRLKLVDWVQQWRLSIQSEEADRFLFQMRLQSTLWRRVLGSHPGLSLELRVRAPSGPGSSLTELCLLIRPSACGREQAGAVLEKWGPELIDSLRKHLQVGPERRKQMRLPFERRLKARPLLAANRVGEELDCEVKDISLGGMRLFLPIKPPSDLLVRLCRNGCDAVVDVPAQVVRSQPIGDGRFEVGVRFTLSEPASAPSPVR